MEKLRKLDVLCVLVILVTFYTIVCLETGHNWIHLRGFSLSFYEGWVKN